MLVSFNSLKNQKQSLQKIYLVTTTTKPKYTDFNNYKKFGGVDNLPTTHTFEDDLNPLRECPLSRECVSTEHLIRCILI